MHCLASRSNQAQSWWSCQLGAHQSLYQSDRAVTYEGDLRLQLLPRDACIKARSNAPQMDDAAAAQRSPLEFVSQPSDIHRVVGVDIEPIRRELPVRFTWRYQ